MASLAYGNLHVLSRMCWHRCMCCTSTRSQFWKPTEHGDEEAASVRNLTNQELITGQ